VIDAARPATRPNAAARDLHFTPADFRRVRGLIHRHAGISLADSKEEMVYSRLSRRLRALQLVDFNEYLDLLENGDPAEWEHFTNALTTNLTSFFRENHHFPILAKHMQGIRRDRPLRIWSCAASTGEEPYSLAITMAEAFGTLSPPVRILATDLDTKVLATAGAAVYDEERVADMPPAQVHKYFERGSGAHAGKVRVRRELVSLVQFRPLNLLAEDWLTLKPFDAIFCRNVMIYFDKATQLALLRKLAQVLEPDGLLFAGHSESLFHAAEFFKLRSNTVYERVARGAAPVRGGLR
jgi:chemotaxis protein methyltransferase CheR